MTIDLLPTVAKLIGAKLPENKIDGGDIGPLLVGDPGARSPHEALYFYYGRELQAVRWGRWKLHLPHGYATLAGRKGGTGGTPAKYEQARIGPALYDLETDPGETVDLQEKHPEVVKKVEAFAEAMREDLGDANRSGKGAREPGRLN
jgi:arylsulfatase A-like enzyme